jgi:hypothetical protein
MRQNAQNSFLPFRLSLPKDGPKRLAQLILWFVKRVKKEMTFLGRK